MLNRDTPRPHKVYARIPKEFVCAIGDNIVRWLEKFESWFSEREEVEGPIDPEPESIRRFRPPGVI
jgi:hypothetical protein